MLLQLYLILMFDSYVVVNGILGGDEIEIEEAPYQVNYGDVCGGVLIHKRWAITTAHCGTESFIRAGNKNRLQSPKVKISKHIVHPLFGKSHEFDYDIQLLLLKKSLRLTKKVQPVRIGGGSCEEVVVAGWGYPKERTDYHTNLQQVKLKLIPFKKCQVVKEKWFNYTLTSTMFCAGESKSKDACQGDSGGAAVCNGTLVGISSFGYGCGRGFPGVYTKLTEASIRQWIEYYTGV